jgi:hypothetical protein
MQLYEYSELVLTMNELHWHCILKVRHSKKVRHRPSLSEIHCVAQMYEAVP